MKKRKNKLEKLEKTQKLYRFFSKKVLHLIGFIVMIKMYYFR